MFELELGNELLEASKLRAFARSRRLGPQARLREHLPEQRARRRGRNVVAAAQIGQAHRLVVVEIADVPARMRRADIGGHDGGVVAVDSAVLVGVAGDALGGGLLEVLLQENQVGQADAAVAAEVAGCPGRPRGCAEVLSQNRKIAATDAAVEVGVAGRGGPERPHVIATFQAVSVAIEGQAGQIMEAVVARDGESVQAMHERSAVHGERDLRRAGVRGRIERDDDIVRIVENAIRAAPRSS